MRLLVTCAAISMAVVAQPATAATTDPFTIAMIPDTQLYAFGQANRNNLSLSAISFGAAIDLFDGGLEGRRDPTVRRYSSRRGIMGRQARWLARNAEELNLKLVTHVGDVTQGTTPAPVPGPDQARTGSPEWNIPEQWDHAVDVYGRLSEGTRRRPGVPTDFAAGNHDISAENWNDIDLWREAFGDRSDFYAGDANFIGYSPNGLNSARVVDVGGGHRILSLSLDYLTSPDNRAQRAQFAERVFATYPDLPAIVTTHENVDEAGQFDEKGRAFQSDIVEQYDQVRLALNGHYTVGSFFDALLGTSRAPEDVPSQDGSAEQVVITQNGGGDVVNILANYQYGAPIDSGYIRLLEFDAEAGTLKNETYSPIFDSFREGYETAWMQDEPFPYGTTADFTVPFDFGFGNDAEEVATVPLMANPLPASAWLFGAALLGLGALVRRRA